MMLIVMTTTTTTLRIVHTYPSSNTHFMLQNFTINPSLHSLLTTATTCDMWRSSLKLRGVRRKHVTCIHAITKCCWLVFETRHTAGCRRSWRRPARRRACAALPAARFLADAVARAYHEWCGRRCRGRGGTGCCAAPTVQLPAVDVTPFSPAATIIRKQTVSRSKRKRQNVWH